MLSQAKLEKVFWAEAVATACYLVNPSPHTTLNFNLLERYGLEFHEITLI